jgi:hypothetical protein
MFDLSTRKPKDTAVVEILDPFDSTPTGITITVAGRYSQAARAATFALADKPSDVANPDSAEAFDAKLLDLLAACTTAWTEVQEHGATLECTPSEAKRLYTEYPWLREQVQVAFLQTADFFGNAARP